MWFWEETLCDRDMKALLTVILGFSGSLRAVKPPTTPLHLLLYVWYLSGWAFVCAFLSVLFFLCCKAAVYLEQRNRLIANSFDAMSWILFVQQVYCQLSLSSHSISVILLTCLFLCLSFLGLTARRLASTVPSALGGCLWGCSYMATFLSLFPQTQSHISSPLM